MNKQRLNKLNNFIDLPLLIITVVCVAFGILAISTAVKSYDGGSGQILIQSLGAVFGFVACFVIACIDYNSLGKITRIIYIFCVAALIAVLIFGTGREDTGSKSWIRFGPIGIQPSEFVKIGFIITFSKSVSDLSGDLNKPKNILKLLIHTGIFLFLIMLQPDFGTMMVFLVIFAAILFSAKISWKYVFGTIVAAACAIPVVWNFFLADYQKQRIMVLFNPESDPLGAGYNVMQSKIAIGSGGFFGKGIGQGSQTQFEYLPAKHTDFIFSVIGEEMGFLGCLICASLLFALIIRCIYISKRAQNKFGTYICIGIASMFLAHTVENIGMCVGLMPVTGIPLPFFSYGGSSIVTNLIAVGLVFSIARHKKEHALSDK